jgi:integrase
MGQTRAMNGTVSISCAENRIRLRFRHLSERYSLNLPLEYSKQNLPKAKKVASIIELDIQAGQLDLTLKKYKNLILSPKQDASSGKCTDVIKLFEHWTKSIRNKDCEVDMDYYCVRSMMEKWGKFIYSEILDKLNSENLSASTYNTRLSMLKNFMTWGVKRNHFRDNPLEDVVRRKVKKKEHANRKPFTQDEMRRILEAIKTDQFNPKCSAFKHSHYYPFVYFLFSTGCRPAEAIGLKVKHLHLSKGQVEIKEALARTIKGSHMKARIQKDTKNSKERFIPISKDTIDILSPLIQGKAPDELVFTSARYGGPIDDSKFLRRVFKPVLEKLEIDYRVLYTARHTFASNLIDKGVNPVMTAFLLGNNPETALKHYVHQLELPKNLPSVM